VQSFLDHLLIGDVVTQNSQLAGEISDLLHETLNHLLGLERNVAELTPQALIICLLNPVGTESHLPNRLPRIMCRGLYGQARLHLHRDCLKNGDECSSVISVITVVVLDGVPKSRRP
jgi:hypothetical protein